MPLAVSRERFRSIFTLALPIVGGMVSQNVLNLVDTAMVGTLGDAALAAVGVASFANFMANAFIQGLSTGVQAMSSRRMGEEKMDEAAIPLNGGLLLALVLGAPLAAILMYFTPDLFPLLNDDPDVIDHGVPYLQIRLFAIASVGMNFSFRGYWNGISRSTLYLQTLLLMHVVNIATNYVLIFGKFGAPALGSKGAAIGTTASTILGTLYYFFMGFRVARGNGFLKRLPSLGSFKTLLRLALPNGVQQLFFAAGFTTLFWIIGQVGTAQVAGASVVLQITLVAILPGLGLGLASASLVGQALGRKDTTDAAQWGWDVAKVGVVIMGLLGLPMLLIPELLLGVFLHDPETVALARGPLRLVGVGIAVDGIGLVLMNSLLGAGAARPVMAVSIITQWFIFLPVAYLIGPHWGYGLMGIWSANVGYRTMSALIFATMWKAGRWKTIQV